jgi:hypothetical protein
MLALMCRCFWSIAQPVARELRNFSSDKDGVFGVAYLGEQDDEFVAAVSSHSIGTAHTSYDATSA